MTFKRLLPKTVIWAFLFLACFGFFNSTAFAHESQTDRSIEVTMHIEPDDTPVPNRPAILLFIINDHSNRFTPSSCDCQMVIESPGDPAYKTILEPAKGQATIFSMEAPFTFPHNGNYTVTLKGNPKHPGDFQNFEVHYSVTLGFMQSLLNFGSHHSAHYLHFLIFGIAIAICVIIIVLEKRKEYRH